MTIKNLIRKNIASLKPYSSARTEFSTQNADIIYLDANENPFDNQVNRYPDPMQSELKDVIAALKGIKKNQIVLGNGSDELLDLVMRAFCEPNIDNVITLPPTYGMYGVLAALNAVENKEVLLSESFQPQIDLIFEAINQKTKLIFLCSPNNPTGNSYSEESVVALLQNFNGIVVLDEAYIDFSKKPSWLNKLNSFQNLIIIQTFSKAYGMAGIRLGALYASPEITTILNNIKPPYNINILTQRFALSKISKISEVEKEVDEIITAKTILLKQLLEVNFIVNMYPTDTNFVLIKVDNASKRYDQLIEKGIVIRNRDSQPLCANCLRITIGTPNENSKLLQALKSIQYV